MFTGIVEASGKVTNIVNQKDNVNFTLFCPFTSELKIDQSLAHNGVCLTVVDIQNQEYTVTAIAETLQKTNLGNLKINDEVNLERCLKLGDRLDGHLVQGHVDQTGLCTNVIEQNGSWQFYFEYDKTQNNLTVSKGSICINGVSLTVVDSGINTFSVCIIPYTFEHTNFKHIQKGTVVNLEFDIIGKYISKNQNLNK